MLSSSSARTFCCSCHSSRWCDWQALLPGTLKLRGAAVGAWHLSTLLLPDGQLALPELMPQHTGQPGETLYIRPDKSKTEQGNRVQTRAVSVVADPVLSPTLWLYRMFMTAAAEAALCRGFCFGRCCPTSKHSRRHHIRVLH